METPNPNIITIALEAKTLENLYALQLLNRQVNGIWFQYKNLRKNADGTYLISFSADITNYTFISEKDLKNDNLKDKSLTDLTQMEVK